LQLLVCLPELAVQAAEAVEGRKLEGRQRHRRAARGLWVEVEEVVEVVVRQAELVERVDRRPRQADVKQADRRQRQADVEQVDRRPRQADVE
jgi:hypothetical protein